jgi:ABC-type glycerol-3-phosphate transport system substrate-binding protein
MMKKKLITLNLLIVLAMLVTALTGCAQGTQAPEATQAGQPAAQQTEAPQATGPVAMDFVTWSYGVETIADNIKKFQEIYPDISVTTRITLLDYHDTMVGQFASEACQLFYGSDYWLQEGPRLAGSNRSTTTARP